MPVLYVDAGGTFALNTTKTPGSDTAWTYAQRLDDPTKPFATLAKAISVAYAGGFGQVDGCEIWVQDPQVALDVRSVNFPKPVEIRPTSLSSKPPAGYNSSITIPSWRFIDCSGFVLSKWYTDKLGIADFYRCSKFKFQSVVTINQSWSLANGCTQFEWDGGCKISRVGSATSTAVAINCRTATSAYGAAPGKTAARYDDFKFSGWIDEVYGDLVHLPNSVLAGGPTAAHKNMRVENAILSRPYNNPNGHTDMIQISGGSQDTAVVGCIQYGAPAGKAGIFMPEQQDPSGSTGQGCHARLKYYNNLVVGTTSARFFCCPDLEVGWNTIWTLGDTQHSPIVRGLDIRKAQSTGSFPAHPSSDWTTIKVFKGNILNALAIGGDGGQPYEMGVVFQPGAKGGNIFSKSADGTVLDYAGGAEPYVLDATDRVFTRATIDQWFMDLTYDANIGKHPDGRIKAAYEALVGNTGSSGTPDTTTPGGGGGTVGDGIPDGATGPMVPVAGYPVSDAVVQAGTAWGGPVSQGRTDDGNAATAVGLNTSTTSVSQGLRYVFAPLADDTPLPASTDATVLGVTVSVEAKQSVAQQAKLTKVQLYAGGTLIGTPKSDATALATSYSLRSYGSPTDSWGLTLAALDAAARQADFGVAFVYTNATGTGTTVLVDYAVLDVAWDTLGSTEPPPAPLAFVNVTPNPALADADIFIDATGSSGSITKYEYSIDNGLTWTVMPQGRATVRLAAATYQVRSRVTGPGGVATSQARSLLVGDPIAPPVARLTVSPASIESAGGQNRFDWSTSTGRIDRFEWRMRSDQPFGNVGLTTSQGFLARPGDEGTYTATVRAIGPGGVGEASVTWTVTAVQPPTLTASVAPSSPLTGQEITVTLTPGGRWTDLYVDFFNTGWQSVDSLSKQIRGLAPPTAGNQPVKVRADGPGGSTVITLTVPVQARPAPIVAFSVSPTSPAVGDAVTIDVDGSSTDINVFEVNWGEDAVFSPFPRTPGRVSHTYVTPGLYPITVRATGPGGTTSALRTVTVTAVPKALRAVLAASEGGRAGQFVRLDARASEGAIASYAFSVDGGETFVDTALTGTYEVVFANPGHFPVVAKVTDKNSQTSVDSLILEVGPAPGENPARLDRLVDELRERGYHEMSADRLRRFLRTAQRTLCNVDGGEWEFLSATARGVAPLDVPDLATVRAVVDYHGRPIEHSPLEHLRASGRKLDQRGEARAFYLRNHRLVQTWPVNDAPITVDYYFAPHGLRNDADHTVIPERFHHLLLDLAHREAAKDRRDWDTVAALTPDIESGIEDMRLAYGQNFTPDAIYPDLDDLC